jgi:hypothetical protein
MWRKIGLIASYAGATLGLLSLALFSNYLAPYVLVGVWFPTLYLITPWRKKSSSTASEKNIWNTGERFPVLFPVGLLVNQGGHDYYLKMF